MGPGCEEEFASHAEPIVRGTIGKIISFRLLSSK